MIVATYIIAKGHKEEEEVAEEEETSETEKKKVEKEGKKNNTRCRYRFFQHNTLLTVLYKTCVWSPEYHPAVLKIKNARKAFCRKLYKIPTIVRRYLQQVLHTPITGY